MRQWSLQIRTECALFVSNGGKNASLKFQTQSLRWQHVNFSALLRGACMCESSGARHYDHSGPPVPLRGEQLCSNPRTLTLTLPSWLFLRKLYWFVTRLQHVATS